MKHIFVFLVLLGSHSLAYAQSAYVAPLNTALATSGLSCNACHDGNFSPSLPMAGDWRKANLVTLDSDGDGISNGIEVRMATDFNVAASKPAGAFANAVFVSTASSLATAAATDLAAETNNTFSIAGSDIIIGGKSITPTLPTAGSVELAFEAFAVSSAKVYEVVAGVATEITPVTVNTKGSITFVTTDAQPKLFVVGVPAASGTGSLTHGEASIYGCLSPVSAMPWMMLGMMFALIMLARRRFK